MKYALVYLIRGKAEKYHQKLVKKVGPKFGENYLIENPIPSHVTLKSPFLVENVKPLEKIIKEFIKNHKSSKIKVDGFGNFRKFVAFLKFKFPTETKIIQKDLLEEVKKIKQIKLHEFDIKWKPHATITYGNSKKIFNEIWNYLKKLDKPNFDLEFDNITILKKPKGKWKVHKVYELEV